MANIKISQLPSATTVTADVDVLPMVHSGVTEKVTPEQLVQEVLKAPGNIGSTTPGNADFADLSANGTVDLSPNNADVTASPTGTGRVVLQPEGGVVINPVSLGSVNNVVIGNSNPNVATFTTLTSTGTTTLNGTTIPASKTLVDTDSTQTLSGKYYLNPRIWDYQQDNYYRISPTSPGLASDVYVFLPVLTGNDTFVFEDFTQTLINKSISGLSNTLTDIGNAALTNSSITIGSSSVSLGGTLSSVSGLSLSSPTISGGTINNAAIGGTTAAAGAFTTLSSTGNTTLGDAAGDTLTINAGTTTFSQGTANGVLYLNGSKVATSGSGLTFDGTNLSVPRLVQSGAGTYGTFNSSGAGNAWASYAYNGSEIGEIGQGSGIISGGSNTDFGLRATNNLLFAISYLERARITSKGFLVGYTSDSSLSGTGNAIFSGNVGIGTSSPTQKLEVNGSALVNGATGFLRVSITNSPATGIAALQISVNSTNARTIRMENTLAGGHTYDIVNGAGGVAGNWGIYDDTAGAYRLTLDSSGNLGLGVTPNTWQASGVLQGKGFSISSMLGVDQTAWATGCYQDTYSDFSGWKSKGAYAPTLYAQSGTKHTWCVTNQSFSGAGQTVVWNQAMTLDASGNLLVGATSGTGKLVVNGAIAQVAGAGSYSLDISANGQAYSNGETVSFPSFSGMIMTNSWDIGDVSVYICGGGTVTKISSTGTAVGTVTYSSGINGYLWTNNTGSTKSMSFAAIRTRPGA